jgi:hypothetical protein
MGLLKHSELDLVEVRDRWFKSTWKSSGSTFQLRPSLIHLSLHSFSM